MPVKILAFDLDYTLIDSKKRIPPENIEALRYAASKGVYIVPATGRIYIGIPEELRTLPFMRWYLTANGSYIYDAVEDRAAARADIPLDQALDFYAWADTMGLLYDCYRDNWGYMSADMREAVLATITDAGVKKLIETLRTPVPELKAYLREKGTGVQKLQLYFSDLNLRARLLNELPQRFPKLAFSSSMPFNIEINAPDATKGCALLTLCTLLGVDPRDTMALGDGTNDLDMIQKAGIGVAMGNAAPSVLAAADYVTGHCDDAGFAKAVYKFC